jgi:hypothetical protein
MLPSLRPSFLRLVAARLICAAGALLIAASASGAERRVLVLPLENLGVEEDEAASLLGILRAEIEQLPGIGVVDISKAGRLVGAECRGEARCLAASGQKVKADEVVYGTVAAVGEEYSIDLKRVLVKQGREADRVTETLSGQRELLIDGVRAAAYKLLLPSQYVGQVQVEMPEQGAEVFVDGRLVGKSPLKNPIPSLSPGQHALKIVFAGYADFDRWVEVRFARVSVVKVDLKNSTIAGVMYAAPPVEPSVASEQPPAAAETQVSATAPEAQAPATLPPMRKVALGAGAGAGLALAGALVSGVVWASARSDAEKLTGPNGVKPEDEADARALSERVSTSATVANVLMAVGGAAALSAGALWLFGAEPAVTPSLAPSSGGAVVGVSGSF